ncbi:hypothetical protein KVR01_004956 [Diaporthe batatas]|uniref:uncharacterized protein n=1 Tax=Diaporthe batatas TaxID=748121 RepID=UPI001D04743A|nr:uncharacterized protein KVR01_004956 [Diaporthe batatas]KAG8164681.1 hypothetical protein KVR01_004956 [Diaporthe batatas]
MSTFLGVNCGLRAAPGLRLNLQKHARAVCSGASRGIIPEPVSGPARLCASLCINAWRQGPGEHARNLTRPQSQQPWRNSARRIEHQRRTFFGSSRVVTHYVDLPPGYADEEGLPFAKQDLDRSATVDIFRSSADMTPHRANKLLRILHGRRVAGSLEDPEVQENTASYTGREINQGLEWLRANVPVDEITNAGLRAEDELRVLESAAESEANEDGAAGKDTSDAGKSSPWSLYKKAGDDNVYGESIIDKIRARNVARREAEEKALEEKRKQEEEAGQQNWGGLSTETGGARQVAMSAKEEAYRAEATSGLEAPPETPRWRLLLPTTVFVAALAPLLWWASGGYSAPAEDARLLAPWLTQADATVYGLMLLNLAVFVAWRRMGAWKFLNKYAIMDMVAPRPTGAVAAIFSHQASSHLVENMFVFWLLGGLLLHDANRAEYLAVFLGSGAVGFLASLYKCVLTRHLTYGLGASSAIFGVICCYFWIHRFEGFKILDLPPDPANGIQGLGIVGLIIGLNLIPLFRQLPGQKDWISHLAGIATGIGFAKLIEERREREKKNEGRISEGQVVGT